MAHTELICEGFPVGIQRSLAGKKITAGRLTLVRSAITLQGAKSSMSVSGYFWAAARALSTVCFALDSTLRPTKEFARETASARAVTSYQLAEALSHWFAQTHLEIDVLAPLESSGASIVKASLDAPFPKSAPSRYRGPSKPALNSIPDFIGLAGGDRHVLESKGRAHFAVGGVTNAIKVRARNKALYQVCRIATVDGAIPSSRVACVFSFQTRMTSGWVTDPGPLANLDLQLDLRQLLKSYYGVVLDPLFVEAATLARDGYVGVEFAPGWTFSIEETVWKGLQAMETEDDAQTFLSSLRESRRDVGRETEIDSFGPDGLRLTGPASFTLPVLRIKKPL